MKNNGFWIFLGCCVLAASIVHAGNEVADQLDNAVEVPDSLYVRTDEGDGTTEYGDYLSVHQAAAYLHLSDENVEELIESGEWENVAHTMGDNRIISKAAVQEWVEAKLRGE